MKLIINDKTIREPIPFENARRETLEVQKANAEAQDRAILTLSSALLALSLSFFRDVFPSNQPIWLILLYTSWILFAIAICITILGFMFSQRTSKYKLDTMQDFFENPERQVEINNYIEHRSNTERHINEVSGMAFIMAVLFSVTFVILNTNKETNMSRQELSQQGEVKKSVPSTPIPTRPVTTPLKQAPVSVPASPQHNQTPKK